jgi:uncharacterized membrane protein
MKMSDRLIAGALFFLAVICIAGIVHILSIFILPALVEDDAFARLSQVGKPAHMVMLPHPNPVTKLVPFADPAIARGLCLFDLSKDALRLRGTLEPDELVTFSFRTRNGYVFYSMTDRAAQHGAIDVLLLSQAQLEAIEAAPTATEEDEPVQELRLVAPEIQGIIFVDALAAFPGEWSKAVQRVARVTCEAEHIAEE